MALATLDSIVKNKEIDLKDIMESFCSWELEGRYTQYGEAFDQGNTCTTAIYQYIMELVHKVSGLTHNHLRSKMAYFTRLFHLDELESLEESEIRSGGYVIEIIEAAVCFVLPIAHCRSTRLFRKAAPEGLVHRFQNNST